MNWLRTLSVSALALACVGAYADAAPTVVLSDSFSRSPSGAIVGTAPLKDTSVPNPPGWVSDWGANNNSVGGGYVTQTYVTYVDGTRFSKVDGTNGISGNYLNNGSTAHPLKLHNASTTITEPIGLPGFAWVQLDHDFAADSVVTNSGKLRVTFDLYRTPAGNISWFLGNGQQNGQNNGNAGSPALNTANDIAIYWRGPGAAGGNWGVRDNGSATPAGFGGASSDSLAYIGSPNLSTVPVPIQIDITGTNFSSGQTSVVEMWAAGVQQDLNGTNVGLGLSFTWDAGGAAYMGFGSNSTPVEGTNAAPIYRASGIDNLVITAVPEPTTLAAVGLLLGSALRRSRR